MFNGEGVELWYDNLVTDDEAHDSHGCRTAGIVFTRAWAGNHYTTLVHCKGQDPGENHVTLHLLGRGRVVKIGASRMVKTGRG